MTTTKKQTASERKIFAQLHELREGMIHLQERIATLEVGKHTEPKALASPCKCACKPDPKDYVLTDADWKRVIDEKFLCEFRDGSIGPFIGPFIGTLECRRNPQSPEYKRTSGSWFISCNLLNKPGVMQPYFGQGMPVPASTRVLVKLRDGHHGILRAADAEWNWVKNGHGDIVAFMVLE